METFRIVALTPPATLDPAIAIAASRAGELGVLNLEFARDEKRTEEAIGRMAHYTRGACGLKLNSTATVFVTQVITDLPPAVELVILTAGNAQTLHQQVPALRQRGLQVLLEVTDVEQARLGEQVGVDGLIAKGHEAGGWVGEETTFILLQRLIAACDLPVWAYGGIGLHTAAACYAAGAAGVVLDMQLALTRESLLPDAVRAAIAAMDGSETTCLGTELGRPFRLYTRPGAGAVQALRETAMTLAQAELAAEEKAQAWRRAVDGRVGWNSLQENVWPVGQDAAFAQPLARQYHTVAGILNAVRQAAQAHVDTARRLRPLDEGAPLARSHNTRYPIVQGPMTRVSDRAEFALKVAEGGALPFLALALMRAPEVRKLLEETQQLLGERPWGVGILGFVPLGLRQEQMEIIRQYRPPFALIAGGRPDQARMLEKEGIPTYLHVPSPGLLRLFLEDGARRFVFEGRECGGHVGPRSSFVLWNTMIDVLLETLPSAQATEYHVLFAGGIHDALSASMVAAMAAPLAERGVRVGVLLGTSYLFTREAVTTGAILPGFQEEALRCRHTVLLETGPGHAIRCAPTPYIDLFYREKQRLLREGRSPDEVRQALEHMNVGRLRIASKGIAHHPRYGQDPRAPKFITVSEPEQHRQGMYMLGQLAALRDRVCTIEELHRDVTVGSTRRLATRGERTPTVTVTSRQERPSNVAIVGMACLLPKAPDLITYWENILNKVDAVTEVPRNRWDWERYFDPDRAARDKVYSKWGGFLDPIPFDPTRYGIPPNALHAIEPIQLLTLEVVRAALADAGYLNRPFPRERTSVILGTGGGVGERGQSYFVRSTLPSLLEDVPEEILEQLPEWTEDSFPGILLNVIAGRVANRFDLGGVNYVVDAACASSLAAVYLATRELEMGTSDMVIVGGVENVQNPFAYLAFSKTRALSPRGRCRTFDDTADGIAISEGLAIVVLKRLEDAERDGDRIYALIKGIAGSSDGRDKSLTAPRPQGQARALTRAYAKAGVSPATVQLVEAHGTGTVVGDRAEVETLRRVFEPAGAPRQSCAIGSVKSMIGHTKSAAGVAGLIKVALALHHKVLPPTIGVEKPNQTARFEESPFYVNTETRPWLQGPVDHPRRAGVSAFGFGGTNFHAVLEEYTGNFLPPQATTQHWPGELFLWTAPSRQALREALAALEQALDQGAQPQLPDLAYTLYKARDLQSPTSNLCLAIVATSLDDLRDKVAWTRQALAAPGPIHISEPRGIYLTETPLAREGRVAFLFPGQGSQYPNMLRDLAVEFPEVRQSFERADQVLADRFPQGLSRYVFPPPVFSEEGERAQKEALTRTNVAQPALGAADMAAFYLLRNLGVHPDMVAGHSYGEYVALCAAGAMDEATLFALSEARGRAIIDAAQDDLGTMAAVRAAPDAVRQALASTSDVWIANLNAPEQTIISGTREGIARAVDQLKAQGLNARPIPVACAFHSPIVAPAQERLAKTLAQVTFAPPAIQVFSNTTAAPYPQDPQAIAALLADHLVRPVRFADEVEAMYAAGARIFVEVGPRNVLTGLTRQILGTRPHVAVHVDMPGRPGLTQLHHALGQLAAHGVPVCLDRLFQGRTVRQLDLSRLVEETTQKPLSPTTWFIDGGRARPVHEPERPLYRPVTLITAHGDDGQRGAAQADGPAVPSPAPASSSSSAGDAGSGGQAPLDGSERVEPVPPTPPPVQAQSPVPDGAEQVMVQFQQLMSRFLETQRNVMLTYLQGQRPPQQGHPLTHPLAKPQAERPAPRPPAQLAEGTANAPAPPSARQPEAHPVLTSASPPADGDPTSVRNRSKLDAAATRAGERPSAVPTSELTPATLPDGHLDRQVLTDHLLRIVSERTGYPPEMLDLDLDLEASLGIDSIKRVEILGRLRQTLTEKGWDGENLDLDSLSDIRTLRGIIDRIVGQGGQTNGPATATPADRQEDIPGGQAVIRPVERETRQTARATRQPIQRFTLRAVERPLTTRAGNLAPGRTVLITDDQTGVAQEVAARLQETGHPVVILQAEGADGEVEGAPSNSPDDAFSLQRIRVDVRSPEAIARALADVRAAQGPVAALIHLLPLRAHLPFEQMNLAAWRHRLSLETRSLFLLSKALRQDLESAAEAGGAAIMAVTGMGGAFASDPSADETPFFPGQGAVTGFLKTLAREWAAVRVKTVDVNPAEGAQHLARYVLTELMADADQPEVGYRNGQRMILESVLSPLLDEENLDINNDWVLLITGGARGITADVALELAERYQPTLILVGRSPLPRAEESPHTAGLTGPREIKAALIERLRAEGQKVTPAQVEKAYHRLLKEREIRRNLSALRRTGARVHYYPVDVRDEGAFAALIDEIYRSFGRLDGVIHGAGIIEDRLVKDKSPDSFDRVFSTKAESAFILARHLRPQSLHFLVFFSSVAGRCGNQGQADYAAANEVLNKLALYLDRHWPARVVSINWGPWEKRGMVSPELLQAFIRRGVALVPPDVGRQMMVEELCRGHKGEVEVIIGGAGGM